MTEAQAKKLGQLVRASRTTRGLSLRAAAEACETTYSWLIQLEEGRYIDPAPDRLARLAEVLKIDPVRIDAITKGALANSLPDVRTYFRAKEKLTPEQLDEVEKTMARLRSKYARQAAKDNPTN